MTHEDALAIISTLHSIDVTITCVWLFTMVIMIMVAFSSNGR